MQFTGEVEHQLDERGRLVIPRDWRPEFRHGAFITRGWYGCLFLFTTNAWAEISEKLATIRLTDTAGDRLRQFLGAGDDVTLDGQGRLLISPALREFAGLNGDVIVTGAITRAEVWDKGRAKQYREQQFASDPLMEMLEKAKELGI